MHDNDDKTHALPANTNGFKSHLLKLKAWRVFQRIL